VLPHDLFSQYLDFIKHRRRPQTHISYQSDLRTFTRFLADTHIKPRKREIGPQLLDTYLAWLTTRSYAAPTIERRLQVLKNVFRWAIQRRFLRDDPFALWEIPRAKVPVVRALTREEERRILAVLATKRTRYARMVEMAIRLARFAGLRRGDCNALRWENVDLVKGVLYVIEGKGDQDAVVPIPDAGLRQPLVAWWEAAGRPESGCVLTGHRGQPLPIAALSRSIARLCRAARVVGATFHTLRATYATRLLEEEVDIRTIQILMRHKSLDTTMRYLEVTDARKREAAQRLDRGL
jgi:site-specific recombinase XerD